MNHVFRNVWNEITRTYAAEAETVKGRGKKSRSSKTARLTMICPANRKRFDNRQPNKPSTTSESGGNTNAAIRLVNNQLRLIRQLAPCIGRSLR